MRVLVVEDNKINLELITYLLKKAGFDVLQAKTGAEAMRLARKRQLDLIVSDVLLPDICGCDLARRLRGDHRSRQIPLVAVTALAMVGDRERIMQAGFDAYISKPIDPRCFLEQINSLVESLERGNLNGYYFGR